MRQTLFYIQDQVADIPVFGVGLLLVLWTLLSIGLIVWLARRQGFSPDTLGYFPVILLVAATVVFVLPGLVEPDLGLPIRSYGVMTMLAIVAAVFLAAQRAAAAGIAKETVYSFAVWFCIAGFVGARVFHVVEYWETGYRHETPDGSFDLGATLAAIVNVPQGGLVVYGALVGSMLAFIWLVRRYRLPALAFADLAAPSMMLGLAIGRLGCLLNGCCFGSICELPWAVTFPENSPPYNRQIERGLAMGVQVEAAAVSDSHQEAESQKISQPATLRNRPVVSWVSPELAKQGLAPGNEIVRIGKIKDPSAEQVWRIFSAASSSGGLVSIGTTEGQEAMLSVIPGPARCLPIHPTQIYSSISALLLCLFLLSYHPFRHRDGEVFGLLITIYPLIRILLEIIRTDEAPQFGTGLSISQLVSVLILVGAGIYWIYLFRQPSGVLHSPATKSRRSNTGS